MLVERLDPPGKRLATLCVGFGQGAAITFTRG